MHSSTFQSLLVLLPLLITGSVALPDNIFGKREALIEERQGGQLAQGTTSATTSAPTGILTGVTGDRHASGNHDGPACMSEGGWQACMSSWCASGGASATAGGEATPTTGGLGGTETTPTSGSNGRMGRRQAASAPATGEAPTETGGPGGHPGGHGPGGHGHGDHEAMCSGFSNFMEGAGASGVVGGAQATSLPTGPTTTP